jgi:hypothetical protein
MSPRATAGSVFQLDSLAVEKTLLIDAHRNQTLILRKGSKALQIALIGDPLTLPALLLAETDVPEPCFRRQLQLLLALLDLRRTGQLLDKHFPPHPHAARNAAVLKALDGHLAGLRHREIAVTLYGPDRVERDWNNPGQNMRDAVRHAITRGISLMERGFLQFLR